jgi:hypothetical protein
MHFMQLRALLPNGHRLVLYTLKTSTTLIVVVDTGGKYAAGVIDTGGNLPPATLTLVANLPPVSLTPVANSPPVSTTPAKQVEKFAAGVVDPSSIYCRCR